MSPPTRPPTRPLAGALSRPRMPRHVRLHFDPLRNAWALLSPEKVLWPDEASLSILRLCDGTASISEIAARLAAEYDADAAAIEADVLALSALGAYRRNFLVRGSTALGYDLAAGLVYFTEHVEGQATKANFTEQVGLTFPDSGRSGS